MKCKCVEYGFYEGMPYNELRQFIADEKYCSSRKYKADPYQPSWICGTVAKSIRAFDHVNAYQDRRRKQLKRDGYNENQIEQKLRTGKKRTRGGPVQAALIEFDFDVLEDKPKRKERLRASA